MQHIAGRTDHVVISVKKLRVPKGNGGADVVNDLHETFLEASRKLTAFFRDPTPALKQETLEALDRHLGEAVAGRKKVNEWREPHLL